MAVLERLVAINPTVQWWIKGDGTDVVKGLWQSVSGEWGGDVDLNDGKLQRLYSELQESLAWINNIGLSDSGINHIKKELEKVLGIISSDLHFISSGKYVHVCIYSTIQYSRSVLHTIIYSALSKHVRVYICV